MLRNKAIQDVEQQAGPMKTTESVVELFLANLNSDATRRVYVREVRAFLGFVQKALAQVALEDILRFKESLRGQQPATVARKLVIVKALLRFGHEQRFLITNVARMLKIPRVHQRAPEILTIEEAEAMLRSPDRRSLQGRRDHAVLALLLVTGLREAELCALDVGDIAPKWSHRVLTVRVGKGGKSRAIALPDGAWDAVAAYLDARGQVDPASPLLLTLGKQGRGPARLTPKAVDHLVAVHARRALISKKVTPHVLRHCACSFALASGASTAEVRDLAGHSSIAISNRYLHSLEAAAGGAARRSPLFQ